MQAHSLPLPIDPSWLSITLTLLHLDFHAKFPPLKPWLPHCRDPPLQSCMAQKSMLANSIGSPSAPVSSLVSCSICSQMAGQPPELPSTSNEIREASKKPSYQEFSCIWGRGRIIQVLITHGVVAEIQAFLVFPEIPSQLLNYCC